MPANQSAARIRHFGPFWHRRLEILREEIRAALAEANGGGDQPDSEDEVDTKAAAHVKPRATTRGS